MIIILSAVLVLTLVCGLSFHLTRNNEPPDVKKVLVRYVLAGEAEPFDSYYAEHAVGEQLRIVSPTVKGYEPRIPVYMARVNSDMNVTVYYDFKAPDVPIRENAVLYRADFVNATTLEEAFSPSKGLTVTSTGGVNSSQPIDYDLEKDMLHCIDNGHIDLEDRAGIFDTPFYTISFSMYFEDFDEVGVSTALSFSYSRYDGSANTRYGKPMRLDSTGKVYLNDATHVTSMHTGEWYNFLIYVDTEAKTCELFINGVSLGQSTMYDPDLANTVKFRIFNTD